MFTITSSKTRHPDRLRADITTMFAWLAAGKITPVIHAVLPLAEARRAHELLESGHVAGKIVLTP